MIKNGMRPVHPGEILFKEFMKPSEPAINANMLAKALEVPANRVTAIIKGQRGITGDTAVLMAVETDVTAQSRLEVLDTIPGGTEKLSRHERVLGEPGPELEPDPIQDVVGPNPDEEPWANVNFPHPFHRRPHLRRREVEPALHPKEIAAVLGG